MTVSSEIELVNKAVGTAIADARRDANMTQLELARALGVGQGAVSRWEAGTRSLTTYFFARITTLLPGFNPTEIFRSIDWPA